MKIDDVDVVRHIAHQGFLDAMEIVQLIELAKRQNTDRVLNNLSDKHAGRAGITVRNSLITRLILLVSRALTPVNNKHPDDRHLRKGFDLISRQSLSSKILQDDTCRIAKLAEARGMLDRVLKDPARKQLKQLRDKETAHFAVHDPDIKRLQYEQMFDFSEAVATVMERFAQAVDVIDEDLDATRPWAENSAENFWQPWQFHMTEKLDETLTRRDSEPA